MRSDRLGPLDPIYDVETQYGAIGAGNSPAVDYVGVTIEQGGTQADPTPFSPIYFDITFTEPVTGLTNGGITLSGTAGASTVILSGAGSSYTIAVSGMTGTGTVIADVDAGAATSISTGAPNQASTSSDNVVQYNTPTEVVYNYTNGNQTFVVPVGITLIEVEYWGSQGGTTNTSPSSPVAGEGGLGGYLLARHTVTPGETLRVMVGGRDDVGGTPSSAGFNGGARSASGDLNSSGGGGGGASDVRHSPYALGNRMAVAGGGGGGGGGVANNRPNSNGGAGNGDGAGLDGSNGSTTPAGKGFGATTSAGGAGGSGDGTWAPTNGDPGIVGDGGAGGYYHGGGGGGGLYGGGGGGGGLGPPGGGGGSGGILDGGLLLDSDVGVRAGHGLIKIRY